MNRAIEAGLRMTDQSDTHTAGPVTGRADPLLDALHGVLVAAVESGSGAGEGIDSIPSPASATLYSLLLDSCCNLNRLHHQGPLLDRDTHWLPGCFEDDHRLVILRAHPVGVLSQAPGR